MKKILITGCAGFIGYNLTLYLLKKNYKIYGIDNLDSYYSIKLKKKRLLELKKFKNFIFIKLDLKKKIENKKLNTNFSLIIHMAAQAGVKESVNNPRKTINNKILIDKSNGIFYNSIKEASKVVGLNQSHLAQMLRGQIINKTNLVYATQGA